MKTESYFKNGSNSHPQKLIPDGMKRLEIPQLRAWLLVPERLTEKQCEAKRADYLKRYGQSLLVNNFKT